MSPWTWIWPASDAGFFSIRQIVEHDTMQTLERWTLNWDYGEAVIQSLGGMLGPVRLDFAPRRSVWPLHVAPWDDDPFLPGILRTLRGEWPCVPFGAVRAPGGLPPAYEVHDASDEWNHGYASNHLWQLVERGLHDIRLRIDYPNEADIVSLERVIAVDPHAPALDVSLTIHARRNTVLPMALHPTFAVPPEGVEIHGCPHSTIHTYPAPVEPEVSQVLADRTANSLATLPTATGTLDATRLPLDIATEEIVQLMDCRPPFMLRYAASGADVLLDWDAHALPDALLWISNGGRAYAPWNGKNFALGVEPLNGFFDLGRVVTPVATHPLATRAGLTLEDGTPRTIRYRISAQPIRTDMPSNSCP
jgi:hypothetical protein